MSNPLHELAVECVVRIGRGPTFLGTGVFVAPGQILTCAHVVRDLDPSSKGTLAVSYMGGEYPAELRAAVPPFDSVTTVLYPPPDIAWLTIAYRDHPCVELDWDEPTLGPPTRDTIWTIGYSTDYRNEPDHTYGWYKAAGRMYAENGLPTGVWQFDNGRVRPGMSGAVLVSNRTGLALGLLTRSRDLENDAGGWGIHVAPQIVSHPEFDGLIQLHDDFHGADDRWRVARRAIKSPATASPVTRLLVRWACDDDHEAVEALPRIMRELGSSHPGIRVVHGRHRAPRASGHRQTRAASKGTELMIILTDDPLQSPDCHDLLQDAAARGERPILIVTSDAASEQHELALDEAGLAVEQVAFGDRRQSPLELLILRYLVSAALTADPAQTGSVTPAVGTDQEVDD